MSWLSVVEHPELPQPRGEGREGRSAGRREAEGAPGRVPRWGRGGVMRGARSRGCAKGRSLAPVMASRSSPRSRSRARGGGRGRGGAHLQDGLAAVGEDDPILVVHEDAGQSHRPERRSHRGLKRLRDSRDARERDRGLERDAVAGAAGETHRRHPRRRGASVSEARGSPETSTIRPLRRR